MLIRGIFILFSLHRRKATEALEYLKLNFFFFFLKKEYLKLADLVDLDRLDWLAKG
jgi:hypothetical protein